VRASGCLTNSYANVQRTAVKYLLVLSRLLSKTLAHGLAASLAKVLHYVLLNLTPPLKREEGPGDGVLYSISKTRKPRFGFGAQIDKVQWRGLWIEMSAEMPMIPRAFSSRKRFSLDYQERRHPATEPRKLCDRHDQTPYRTPIAGVMRLPRYIVCKRSE
jgi:hypothetical protein